MANEEIRIDLDNICDTIAEPKQHHHRVVLDTSSPIELGEVNVKKVSLGDNIIPVGSALLGGAAAQLATGLIARAMGTGLSFVVGKTVNGINGLRNKRKAKKAKRDFKNEVVSEVEASETSEN